MDSMETLLMGEVTFQWAKEVNELRERVSAMAEDEHSEWLKAIETDLGRLGKRIIRVHNGLANEVLRKGEVPF